MTAPSDRKSLAEMAAEAAGGRAGIECPDCGCRDFQRYKSQSGIDPGKMYRYKACRNCGKKVLTLTESQERIVRDVTPHSDDEGEAVLRIAE